MMVGSINRAVVQAWNGRVVWNQVEDWGNATRPVFGLWWWIEHAVGTRWVR